MKKFYYVIGLMSGTSLDGIDLAYLKTDGKEFVEALHGATYAYDAPTQQKIRSVLGIDHLSPQVQEIAQILTQKHIEAVQQFLSTHNINPKSVDVIGFHGQTIFHQPRLDEQNARTLQIGDGKMLAQETDIDVIHGLRYNDVENGGEGAPLAPIFHQAIVQDLPHPVAVLNIGGVANVTWVHETDILAFDTGPGNALINDWVFDHTNEPYDVDGTYAKNGVVHNDVLEKFMQHPYFTKPFPKSLDRNTFKPPFKKGELSLEDGAATLMQATISSILQARDSFPIPPKTWIVTGGGVHNTAMMAGLTKELSPALVHPITKIGWEPDYLEANAFAYLAARFCANLPISFPQTTGVPKPMTGGILAAAL